MRLPSEFYRLLENASMTYKMFMQQPASWCLNPCMVSTVSDVRIRMARSEKLLGLLSWDQWEDAWATEGGVGRRLVP